MSALRRLQKDRSTVVDSPTWVDVPGAFGQAALDNLLMMALSAFITLLMFATPDQAASRPELPPQHFVEAAADLRCHADDDECLRNEFVLRRQADQAVRNPAVVKAACEDASNTGPTEQSCGQKLWHGVDAANLSRLQQIVSTRGWPPLGGDAEVGAWLIAQHAPRDAQSFRETVLTALMGAVQAGRLDPQYLAMMADRNAIYLGGSQLYGTQRYCVDGKLDMKLIGDVDQADQRRAAIGMEFSLTESLSNMNELCAADFERDAKPS